MAVVQVADSDTYELAESTSGGGLDTVRTFDQYYVDEQTFVDTGAFPFNPPFAATPVASEYTARYADGDQPVIEMQVWSDSVYPAITAVLYKPDGTLLLDGTETVNFDASLPGTAVSAPCTYVDGAVVFDWPAGMNPGVYQARWTVETDTTRISVPTTPIILRVADET